MVAIAFDLVNSEDQNLISFTNFAPAFSSPGDGFGVFQRGVSATIPFSLLDDSLTIFPGDTLGIVGESNTEEFFGVTDTENDDNSGPVTAEWVFDISDATNLSLSIDMAAMGDFEASGDSFVWSYSIDGGAAVEIFTSTVNEDASQTYTLDDGDQFTLSDPLLINDVILDDDFQTLTAAINGTGSALTLQLVAQTDGGSEAYAVQNILVEDGTTPSTPNVAINEIRIDQPGSDDDEYVELVGVPSASLDGLTYLVVGDGSGGSGVIENVTDLSGQSIPDDGFFLAAEDDDTFGAIADLITSLNFENSDNVTHLLVQDFTGSIGDDLDADDDGVLDTTPWSRVIDSVALIEDLTDGEQVYSATQVGPDGSFVPGQVFRLPDGSGDFQIGAFGGGDDTPGASNAVEDEQPPFAAIYDIQGPGHVSPFVLDEGETVVDFFDTLPENIFSISGEAVTTTGIVTAVDTNGFYLQDPTGDGDLATSDAIFVFTGGNPAVAIGDELEVSGTVAEFFPGNTDTRNLPTTQLTNITIEEVISTGNGLPATTLIGPDGRILPTEDIDDDAFTLFDPDADGIDFFESLEAMRVTAQNLVAVAPTNRFGEIFAVSDLDPDMPGIQGATGISDRGTLNISPDDFNPEKIQIDEDSGVFNFDFPSVDTGAVLGDVTGVVSYGFGNFEILPTVDFTSNIEPSDLEPEVVEFVGTDHELTVATYNVLNLDPNDSDGDMDIANGRFEAIAEQIVNNLATPDVIALQEIQDNDGSVISGISEADLTLQTLVDAIRAAGGPIYEFIDTPNVIPTFINEDGETVRPSGGQPGSNIRNAFLYNPDRVDLVDGSVEAIGSQEPGGTFEGARRPLVATFEFNGENVTLVNNHFSSKGGSAPILGIEQPFEERQEDETVNGSLDERLVQSDAVQAFVTDVLDSNADARIAVLGDLNEFEFVSPVLELEEAGLTNLAVATLPENEIYSFIFQGNSQALDHILSSDRLLEHFDFDIVHVNAEFAETDGRASDHEPLLARFLIAEGQTIEGGNGKDLLVGGKGDDRILGGNGKDMLFGDKGYDTLEGGNGPDLLNGGSGNDTLEGGNGPDVFVIGEGTDTIIDFKKPDKIGLIEGLSFGALSFDQSNGDVLISADNTLLAIVENSLVGALNHPSNFVTA